MTETETLALALSLEVSLDVDAESGRVTATPKKSITPELREAIKENRDDLRRTLLFRRAASHLQKSGANEGGPKIPDENDVGLNRAWTEGSWEEFRGALREWTRAGMRAIAKKKAVA